MSQTDTLGNRPLVRVESLTKHFSVRIGAYGETKATVHALDDVSFTVQRGETLGLVGESGCGKSTAGLTLLQLHTPTSGKVFFEDTEVTGLADKEMRPLRQKMQIIFQDPYSTLSPRMTIGNAISEPLWLHNLASEQGAQERIAELLDNVGLNPAFAFRYPHEFSGGQRQRVCIARALACEPEFIVCDEPISALDVSIQAQIINLLQDLQESYHLTYLFIAHDLAVVRHISDRVAVMYLGRVVEMAPKDRLFGNPLHPYTHALLAAVPVPNPRQERQREHSVIRGNVPSAINPPSGCRFHPRCPLAFEPCDHVVPEWREVESGHWVACHAV
ncbi:MAG: ABC transporter ATP-binding protein [Caldilineaceae bacterium]|nr:ABC transporter ATP-binding protein [Caldilineaceae bacterium]MCY4118253.1 ABC transporter ATP-binding protein [Caldilineaceae bacterium]MDE0069209.1 ABC transporter ATP-binding protein [Caldilineaceae bacterium]